MFNFWKQNNKKEKFFYEELNSMEEDGKWIDLDREILFNKIIEENKLEKEFIWQIGFEDVENHNLFDFKNFETENYAVKNFKDPLERSYSLTFSLF